MKKLSISERSELEVLIITMTPQRDQEHRRVLLVTRSVIILQALAFLFAFANVWRLRAMEFRYAILASAIVLVVLYLTCMSSAIRNYIREKKQYEDFIRLGR